MQRRKNMEVRCWLDNYADLKLYENPKDTIIVKSIPCSTTRIGIVIDGKTIEVVGRDLKKAIDNCLNV